MVLCNGKRKKNTKEALMIPGMEVRDTNERKKTIQSGKEGGGQKWEPSILEANNAKHFRTSLNRSLYIHPWFTRLFRMRFSRPRQPLRLCPLLREEKVVEKEEASLFLRHFLSLSLAKNTHNPWMGEVAKSYIQFSRFPPPTCSTLEANLFSNWISLFFPPISFFLFSEGVGGRRERERVGVRQDSIPSLLFISLFFLASSPCFSLIPLLRAERL